MIDSLKKHGSSVFRMELPFCNDDINCPTYSGNTIEPTSCIQVISELSSGYSWDHHIVRSPTACPKNIGEMTKNIRKTASWTQKL